MPLKIVTRFDLPGQFRQVVYTPDSADRQRPRPTGNLFRDKAGQLRSARAEAAPAKFFIGLDLGQMADFTAVAIIEKTATGLAVRHLDRVRGLPYTTIVQMISNLMARPELAGQSCLVADGTGVGVAVMDLLRSAGLAPISITITSGRRVTGSKRSPKVPKGDLINGLLLSFQSGAVQISSALPHAATLSAELAAMRRKLSVSGNASYGAWRDGEHDDLVLALAIALWKSERPGVTMAAPALPDRPDYSHELPDDADE